MAKRGNASTTRKVTAATKGEATGGPSNAPIEQRLIEFAEQLGHFAGNLQAKADHLLDRDALTAQMAGVRESAAELLAQLTAGAKQASATAARAVGRTSQAQVPRKKAAASAKSAARKTASAAATTKGRSGGVVDAPGKKRRAPLPKDPQAAQARSQTAKMRDVMPMAKTSRHRGRG